MNGYCKSDETWRANGGIAKLIVYLNGAAVCVAELLDDASLQVVDFGELLVLSETDILGFSILEIYPGTTSDNIAVSELHIF